MIYGKDDSRKGWFDEDDVKDITDIIVSRKKMEISATRIRELLVEDNYDLWCKFVPKEIQGEYEFLRNELLKIKEYCQKM